MSDPFDIDYWFAEAQILYDILFPLFRLSTVSAAQKSYVEISAMADIGVSWDVFNAFAVQYAQQHTAEVVAQITKTSMDAFLANFDEWVQSGNPISDLIQRLEPYYGPVRAEMVAVTETTRAYANGNLAVWRNTGMVEKFRVQSAEDDLVCPICSGVVSGNDYSLDAEAPPYHVRCRCWIVPVLTGF